ncbi:hypothetical protein ACFL5H_04035 [Candidatus Latescibacterota bacterium]
MSRYGEESPCLPGEISLFQYGALGLGAYPYRPSLPAAGVRVTIDGVPLRSRSPFGPDLEIIPAAFVDSVAVSGFGNLTVTTVDSIPTVPVTDTRFLLGIRRRFTMDVVFSRPVGKRSGITFGGSANGLQGHYTQGVDSFIPKNNLRHYLLTYRRDLDRGGVFTLSLRGLRDRDGLADLDSLVSMGERKTDETTFAAGARSLPISGTTTLSPLVYYQRSNSRFDRYGLRKSLDDNVLGMSLTADKHLGDTHYRVHLNHEWNYFSSRIHREAWTRRESAVGGSFDYHGGILRLLVDGSVRYNSEYGFGSDVGAELAAVKNTIGEALVRVQGGSLYPDPGQEYFGSLVFSDTTAVNTLARGSFFEAEAGIRLMTALGQAEIVGFGSRSKSPLFVPASATYDVSRIRFFLLPYHTSLVEMADGLTSRGVRITGDVSFEKRYRYHIRTTNSIRWDNNGSRWMYPAFYSQTDGTVVGTFFDGRMEVTGFGRAAVRWWDENDLVPAQASPAGTRFLLDAGVSVMVSTLELFYRVENITGEDISWFRVLDWQGRNKMYGGRWIFYQ